MKAFFGNKWSYGNIYLYIAVSILTFSCVGNQSKIPKETPTNGTINISVDESFKPVIDSEIKVFESSFPNAKIIVHYKPEAACFRDLASDSARLIIVTRGLSKKEQDFFNDSFHLIPSFGILAYDAIAVVVNNHSKDTILSMDEVRSLLNGTDKNHMQVVMDGVSATSTVRYAMDSILHGQPLGKNVVAADSSEAVINYVSEHPNSVGFIGVSWIGDQDDPQQLHFKSKVKVAAVECTRCMGETHVEPWQANIVYQRYPMIRGLNYILNEDFDGVGSNFVNFLQFERGQLIFLRAYLVPGRMSFDIRASKISN